MEKPADAVAVVAMEAASGDEAEKEVMTVDEEGWAAKETTAVERVAEKVEVKMEDMEVGVVNVVDAEAN